MKDQSLRTRLIFGVAPILVSLLVTALLIILVGSDPIAVASKLWSGAFADLLSASNVVRPNNMTKLRTETPPSLISTFGSYHFIPRP